MRGQRVLDLGCHCGGCVVGWLGGSVEEVGLDLKEVMSMLDAVIHGFSLVKIAYLPRGRGVVFKLSLRAMEGLVKKDRWQGEAAAAMSTWSEAEQEDGREANRLPKKGGDVAVLSPWQSNSRWK